MSEGVDKISKDEIKLEAKQITVQIKKTKGFRPVKIKLKENSGFNKLEVKMFGGEEANLELKPLLGRIFKYKLRATPDITSQINLPLFIEVEVKNAETEEIKEKEEGGE